MPGIALVVKHFVTQVQLIIMSEKKMYFKFQLSFCVQKNIAPLGEN